MFLHVDQIYIRHQKYDMKILQKINILMRTNIHVPSIEILEQLNWFHGND